MPKTRHVIRPDVKAQILGRLKEDGVPVAQLAEEHAISTKTIYNHHRIHLALKMAPRQYLVEQASLVAV